MSKNLTRKGLAFGALVALGASVFAGAPAYAADTMVLEANYSSDKTLAVPITETISLSASLGPNSTAANISNLKFKIVNNGTLTVAYNSTNGTDVTGTVTSAEGSEYVTPNTTSSVAVNELQLNLDSEALTSATQTVTVTAFLDVSNFGVLDAGEVQSSQTISFVKLSEITTSTTITSPTQGDTAVTAVVKFTNVNNQALTPANVGAYFSKGDGDALAGSTGDAVSTAANGDVAVATPATGSVTITAANTYAAGDIVTIASMQASLNGTYKIVSATSTDFVIANAAGSVTDGVGTITRTKVLKTLVDYSATNAGFKYTTSTVTALQKDSAVKVQPLLSTALGTNAALKAGDAASATTVDAVAIGTAQTAAVTTRALASFSGNTVLSTTADAGTLGASPTADVALNKEKQVYFIAKDTATTVPAGGNPKAGQAVAVTVTVSGATLSAVGGVSVTVNGTTYTSAASLPGATGVAKLALTTGADGKATITYKTAGFTNGQDVIFTAVAENFTVVVTGNEEDLTYSQYIENNEGNTAVTTDGVAVPVTVVVQDQFGGAPADNTFQISATLVANDQVTPATSGAGSDTFEKVVGGKATLNLKDNGTGIGTLVFGLIRYSVNPNGVVSSPVDFSNVAISANPTFSTTFATGAATVGGGSGEADRFDLVVKTAADIAAGDVLLKTDNTFATALSKNTAETAYVLGAVRGGGTAAELTYSDFASVDLRKIAVLAPEIKNFAGSTGTAANFYGTVFGVVKSASTATYGGVAVPSATVKASAEGLLFRSSLDSKDIWGDGTITLQANASGQFTLYVYSHKAGTQTVTITSGTGTAKIEVVFEAAANAAASSVSVKVADSAAQFQAGRALDVTVTVTDKFGNPIALTAATGWDAAGEAKLVVAQTGSGYLSTLGDGSTSAKGVFTSKLITNAGDLGTSTITATVDFYTTTVTDLTKSVASEFGVTDADVTVGGRAVYASVEFAKGKTVTVSVDGKRLYSKLFSTDAYTELKFTQKTAGKHTVTVRISGGIVYSEVVTTTK